MIPFFFSFFPFSFFFFFFFLRMETGVAVAAAVVVPPNPFPGTPSLGTLYPPPVNPVLCTWWYRVVRPTSCRGVVSGLTTRAAEAASLDPTSDDDDDGDGPSSFFSEFLSDDDTTDKFFLERRRPPVHISNGERLPTDDTPQPPPPPPPPPPPRPTGVPLPIPIPLPPLPHHRPCALSVILFVSRQVTRTVWVPLPLLPPPPPPPPDASGEQSSGIGRILRLVFGVVVAAVVDDAVNPRTRSLPTFELLFSSALHCATVASGVVVSQ